MWLFPMTNFLPCHFCTILNEMQSQTFILLSHHYYVFDFAYTILHNVWKFLLVFVNTIYEYLKNCMEWFNEIVGRISVYILFHILINSKGQWNIVLLLKAAIIMITSISQMSAVFQNQPETSKSIDVMWHTKIFTQLHA